MIRKVKQTIAGLSALAADKNMRKAAGNMAASAKARESSKAWRDTLKNNKSLSPVNKDRFKGYALSESHKATRKKEKAERQKKGQIDNIVEQTDGCDTNLYNK